MIKVKWIVIERNETLYRIDLALFDTITAPWFFSKSTNLSLKDVFKTETIIQSLPDTSIILIEFKHRM